MLAVIHTATVDLNIGLIVYFNRLLIFFTGCPTMDCVLPASVELIVFPSHIIMQDRCLVFTF